MKLCEVYESIQGEGPNTGEPTTFVRFGGCNLRCAGWGFGTLPDGTIVPGCDTVFAVYPEWRDTWESQTSQEVADKVSAFPTRICLTGGEPLIQPKRQMEDLVKILLQRHHTIDLFTNGTRILPEWARSRYVTVVMDYKLPGSAEYGSFDPRNVDLLGPKDAIKFVVKDTDDLEIAKEVLEGHNWSCQVYFGVVWGKLDPATLVGRIPPKAMLNLQTHKYVFGDIRGT